VQDEILARLGVPEDFAIYPAMTFAHKNHLRLFEAMAILRSRYGIHLPLVLTGRRVASRDAVIEQALQRFDLQGTVRHVGAVSEDELATLFCRARFMVFPSLFEGLGLPLLEAMHQNLPIAAGRTSCVPETVGQAALLFDPLDPSSIAEAMHRLNQDDVLRAQLAAAGGLQIARFRNARSRETFFAAYRSVAGASLTREEAVLMEEARGRRA
jgi:glycosyltransferase involved in cell wall biosynthesis